MKITKEQELEFALQYSECINQLVKSMAQSRQDNVILLREFDFKCDHSFKDLAKEMFLQNLKQFHDHHHDIEAAVQGVKSIIG